MPENELPGKTAYVIGSGPNGLTAAIMLARAGLPTTVLEAEPIIGGGTRSAELTLPGFTHDICSAVHPLAVSSPAFRMFPLAEHGLEWIHPPAPLAHPLDNGSCVLTDRSVEITARRLGSDERAYRRKMGPFVARWKDLISEILAPPHLPRYPFLMARFGMVAPWSAASTARRIFRTEEARALFAGMAGHSSLAFEKPGSAAFGWMLTLSCHGAGWPIPRGGSQRIANALASYFESLGGRIVTGTRVTSLDELTDARMVLCDFSPRQLLNIAGDQLTRPFARKMERYRYGPGAYKLDWALNGPIPWTASGCSQTAMLHLGGTLDEIAAAERAPWQCNTADRPYVLLAQPSLFDPSRAPAGKHTGWAYCHVPNGCTEDMTERIEAQVERFAPGFRARIIGRSVTTSADMERHNANLIGGDINGGSQDLAQMILRPTRNLYRTSLRGLYFCSSSTPPGGGVHGMCGYHAARVALKDAGIPVR